MTGTARPASGLFSEPREVNALGDLFANIWQLWWVTTTSSAGWPTCASASAWRS